MKNQKTLIAGLALVLTFGVASFSGAQGTTQGEHMGMNDGQPMKHCNMMKGGMMKGDGMMDHGKMNHGDMMGGDVARLTEAQQKEVQAIEAKYADEVATLDTAITAKRTTMHTAMANDATTVGEMKKMRQGMISLHQDRQALAKKINTEISAKIGIDYVATGHNCPMDQGGSGCMKMGMMMDEGMHHGGEKHGAAVHM